MNTSLRSPLRPWGVILLLITAGVHLPLVPEHLEEAAYVGVLFLLLSAACVVLSVLLVVRDSQLVWFATGVVMMLALLAFVVSRTVGLPDLAGDIGNWSEPLGFPALVAEALSLLVVAFALRQRTPAPSKGLP